MRKGLSLWMLGIAAMLASCSNEDVLQGGGENNGLVRITAQLENGMKTRAADDENSGINRYVLEVYTVAADGTETKDGQLSTSNATGTFALQLDRSKSYRFYCWADAGASSSYDVSQGLSSITLNQNANPTTAHRGWTEEVVPGSTSGSMDIPMKHAVAKVVLKTTKSLGAGEARVETETYTQYNAITNEYTAKATEKVGETGPEASITITDGTPVEALSFYILTGKETQAAELKYTPTGETDTYTKTLDNVPFEADCRTIFTGDLEGLWFNTASITAELDKDWTDENKLDMDGYTIELTEETTLTPAMLSQALGDGNIVAVKGMVTEASMKTVFSWLKGESTETIPADGVNLDLSGGATATNFDYIGTVNAGTPNFSQDLSFGNDDADKTKLRSIILPEGLKTIGQNAFYYCKNLTSVTLPQGLEKISGHPFVGTGIPEIDLPSSVVSANLYSTPDLKIVHIRGNIESFYAWDFSYCGSLTDIYFHGNTTAPSSASVFRRV